MHWWFVAHTHFELTDVCVCRGTFKVLCVCMCLCGSLPAPQLCSLSTMSHTLKCGAAWWQADRLGTMHCNLWGALLRKEWWVIKRKTLRDTAGAWWQATGLWLCVPTSQQTLVWFSHNRLIPHFVSHTHTRTRAHALDLLPDYIPRTDAVCLCMWRFLFSQKKNTYFKKSHRLFQLFLASYFQVNLFQF